MPKSSNLVHDELVVECREESVAAVETLIKKAMIRAGQDFLKSVPVEVNITVDDVWRK